MATTRIEPAALNIFMGTPSVEGEKHARERLHYQLRVLAIVWLLRANDLIAASAMAEPGKTLYQHGSGAPGEQAAHKLMAYIYVGGKPLDELSPAPGFKTFMVFLHSDTTVLPRCWNMADDLVETGGMRDYVMALANSIISKTEPGAAYGEYATCMTEIWGLLQSKYTFVCDQALKGCVAGKEQNETKLQKISANLQKPGIPQGELQKQFDKTTINLNDCVKMEPVLQKYKEVAGQMSFPLTVGELDNMWDLVFGQPPRKV